MVRAASVRGDCNQRDKNRNYSVIRIQKASQKRFFASERLSVYRTVDCPSLVFDGVRRLIWCRFEAFMCAVWSAIAIMQV